MNDLEKQSFYSFVLLYLTSSFIFVLLSGYWYFNAQKNALESENYYKLTHIADEYSGMIIKSQMKGTTLHLPNYQGYEYFLLSIKEAQKYKRGYYEADGYKVLVSDSPQEHLGVKYILIRTKIYFQKLHTLVKNVLTMMGFSFVGIVLISILLSKLFLQPMRTRVQQIESFIQDISHELNTPITALGMSASRGLKKGVYDKKILTNISISTKQLQSIYKSLTYLNFNNQTQKAELIALAPIVEQTIAYYNELSTAKQITIISDITAMSFTILPLEAELLFSNLLSNAIKYSMPQSSIKITLNQDFFLIEDEGMGIAKEKLDSIFTLYQRHSTLAGGFGVGLSIVKQICDTAGIKIEVHSQLGVGSSFRLLWNP